jgi:hypothetical protein
MITEECVKRPLPRLKKRKMKLQSTIASEKGNSYWLEFSIAIIIFFLGVLILMMST